MTDQNEPTFQKQLEELINKNSIENGSDTPDFILAQYLADCLRAWNYATLMREKWYGRERQPAFPPAIAPDGGWPQSTEQPNVKSSPTATENNPMTPTNPKI